MNEKKAVFTILKFEFLKSPIKSTWVDFIGLYSKSPVRINPWINPGLIRGVDFIGQPCNVHLTLE